MEELPKSLGPEGTTSRVSANTTNGARFHEDPKVFTDQTP